MSPESKKISPETLRAREMLRAAQTIPTDKGMASCIGHVRLYERLAVTLRPDPVDLAEAAGICSNCPLLAHCSVAITTPGG